MYLFTLTPNFKPISQLSVFLLGQVSVLVELADPDSLFYIIASFEATKCLSYIFQLQMHSFLQCDLKWNLVGAAQSYDEKVK